MDTRDWDIVRRTALFSGLDRATLGALLTDAQIAAYPNDTLLFSRGDVSDRFFVVLDGTVRLLALDPNGRQAVIEVVQPGQSFAEAAVLGLGRFPVDAEATAGSRLLHVRRRSFVLQVEEHAGIGLRMLDGLARWERHLIAELADLKVRSPGQRLAALLLDRVGATDGPAVVTLTQSKAELAGLIGVTPESLSRALGRLQSLGVRAEGRQMTIADVERLRRFRDDLTGEAPA